MIRAIHKGSRAQREATSAVTALVSTRLYAVQAPLEAALPHLVFFVSAGGSANSNQRDELDAVVTVRGVAESADAATQIADAVRTALHNASITLDSPWTAYRCQHQATFAFSENEERRTYWYAGGTYRLRAFGA
jgi:hypothetical protein